MDQHADIQLVLLLFDSKGLKDVEVLEPCNFLRFNDDVNDRVGRLDDILLDLTFLVVLEAPVDVPQETLEGGGSDRFEGMLFKGFCGDIELMLKVY